MSGLEKFFYVKRIIITTKNQGYNKLQMPCHKSHNYWEQTVTSICQTTTLSAEWTWKFALLWSTKQKEYLGSKRLPVDIHILVGILTFCFLVQIIRAVLKNFIDSEAVRSIICVVHQIFRGVEGRLLEGHHWGLSPIWKANQSCWKIAIWWCPSSSDTFSIQRELQLSGQHTPFAQVRPNSSWTIVNLLCPRLALAQTVEHRATSIQVSIHSSPLERDIIHEIARPLVPWPAPGYWNDTFF